MSFVYNPKLLRELLKYGQAADPYAQQTTNFAAIRHLIGNLEKRITGADTTGTQVSHHGDPGTKVQIRMQDMENLGALANFLLVNKITVGGKRIVFSEGEDPHTEDYQIYKLEPGGSLIETTNRTQQPQGAAGTFVINKELLSAYLVSLQASEQKRPNRFVSVVLSKLIQQTNNLLDTKISEKYVAPGQPGTSPAAGQPGSGAGAGGAAGNANILQELVGEQVFDVDSIDLQKIATFADRYAEWANRADTNSLRDKIHTSIAEANGYLAAPGIIQVTNISQQEFKNLCKNGANAKRLALTLDTIVSYAGRMMIDLANVVERSFRNGKQAANFLRQQTAQGGPQQSNLSMLEQMARLS